MKFKKSLIVAVVLLLSATAQAQTDHEKKSVSLQLGDKVILIPTPASYEEVTAEFENLKARFAATEPPQSELLLGYLPSSDYDLLKSGKEATFEYYAKIAVIRVLKERTVPVEEYAAVVKYIKGNDAKILNGNSPNVKKVFEQFDKQLSKEFSQDVKSEAVMTVLGAFDERPNVYSSMISATLKREVGGKVGLFPLLGTINVLHIKDRMISVATYRGYKSQADLEALKTFTTNWVNSILAANK